MAVNQDPGERGASAPRNPAASGGTYRDPIETVEGEGPAGFTAGQYAGAHEGVRSAGGDSLTESGGTQDWASDFRQDDHEQYAGDADGASDSDGIEQAREKAGAVA